MTVLLFRRFLGSEKRNSLDIEFYYFPTISLFHNFFLPFLYPEITTNLIKVSDLVPMKVYMPCLFMLLLLVSSCSTNIDRLLSKEELPKQTPPNIVIIFTDDQGYQDLGCYGSPDIKTPNIDRMAREGVKLTNFYVSQPVCSASRASLLTGCYANRVGVHGAYFPMVGKGLHTEEVTIAEMLKPLGYATGIFGKWHLGSEPQFLPSQQGFDEYYGIPYSNDMWPLHPANDYFQFSDLPLIENDEVIDYVKQDQNNLTTSITQKAVRFIEEHKEEPFFLYVPHPMPHVPLYVSDKKRGTSDRGLYGDVIEEIDWSTGEILKALESNGLTENTLVIFTSDNGPWLNYGGHSGEALPLREGKGTAWEGGVRVPCVMYWKNSLSGGRTIEQPAMTIDLFPTIATFTGASLPNRTIDGKDMSSLLLGKPTTPHQEAYFFYYHTNELHAVLSGDGRWKLYLPHRYRTLNGRVGTNDGLPINYEHNTTGLELYDLQNDIGETTDVSYRHPDIVASLQLHAEHIRTELGDQLTGRKGSGVRPGGLVE